MAALTTMPMAELNEDRKQVYPLFQKKSKAPAARPDSVENHALAQSSDLQSPLELTGPQYGQAELLEVDPNNGRRKRRKTPSSVNEIPSGDAKDKSFPKIKQSQWGKRESDSKAKEAIPETGRHTVHKISGSMEMDTEQSGDKDPATNSPELLAKPKIQDLQAAPPRKASPQDNAHPLATCHPNAESIPTDRPLKISSAATTSAENKPQKILWWNPKTGTIGSPPQKKHLPVTETVGKTATQHASKRRKSRIVTFRYGHGHHLPVGIGPRIEQILTNAKPAPPVAETPALTSTEVPLYSLKAARQAPTKDPKSIHPLFMAKTSSNPPSLIENRTLRSRPLVATNTQTSKVVEKKRSQLCDNRRSPYRSSESSFSGFGKSTGILKFPGAIEPAWPWQGMVHIRGDGGCSKPMLPNTSDMLKLQTRPKKSKYQAVEVLKQEDVIGVLSKSLCISDVLEDIQKLSPDEFPSPPACLRIPTKHYEGGSALQRRVRKEVSTKIPISKPAQASSSEDELQGGSATRTQTHPALTKTYNLIATSQSAFDQGQCETQAWTNKYSPKCASEVLQSGRDAMILKDWLQTLTVKSVQTGAEDKSRSRGSSLSGAGQRSDGGGKRKRKSKKLEGFVVSSDEEIDDMDELTDPEDDASSLGGPSLLKKTVIRGGDTAPRGYKEPSRLLNTVVVSGPHGCGKSAAVYAVAKELGFEVFEINSSSRRSGRDILEKVGDMTRNHLVQQSHGEASGDDDNELVDEALARDLKTGRQGTMNSFFKLKEASGSGAKPVKRPLLDGKARSKREDVAPKAPAKQQKQSLILIEEADIIFEEDKQFWATILSLVSQSKRPLVITCNDESAIPLLSLSLKAIIRFNTPAVDLAVDYMLLVAACEGHIIRRDAVKTLYESRSLDLRASLTELNFWCQFAIGDCKSGLGWFVPRWPKKAKADEDGESIRVVSEGTYEAGMGWLCRDNLESRSCYLNVQEEILHEAWDGWHLDVGDWHKTTHLQSWATKNQETLKDRKDGRAALGIYEEFIDAMSAADLCSGSSFSSDYQIPIETSLPPLSTKSREDYILGYDLLEASPLVDFNMVTKDIALSMKTRARKYMQVDQHINHLLNVPTELGFPSEARLIRLITEQICTPESRICRHDFSLAFDPISEPEKQSLSTTGSLEASSFDRTITMIAVDLAPYVRSIVSYDAHLQEDRARLSNLLSEGGRKGKRMRTTRAAISALEGGARNTTRKNRYFGSKLNSNLVLKTGMQTWLDAVLAEDKSRRSGVSPSKGSEGRLAGEDSGSEYDELHQEGGMSADQKANNKV